MRLGAEPDWAAPCPQHDLERNPAFRRVSPLSGDMRSGGYVPPVLEMMGLAEVEHNPKGNRMRAI